MNENCILLLSVKESIQYWLGNASCVTLKHIIKNTDILIEVNHMSSFQTTLMH